MNIFSRIFRKAKPPEGETERAEILGGGNSFSAWNGDAYANDIYRGAVDAIARNVAKLKGSHVIRYADHDRTEGDDKKNRIQQREQNPYLSDVEVMSKMATTDYL